MKNPGTNPKVLHYLTPLGAHAISYRGTVRPEGAGVGDQVRERVLSTFMDTRGDDKQMLDNLMSVTEGLIQVHDVSALLD